MGRLIVTVAHAVGLRPPAPRAWLRLRLLSLPRPPSPDSLPRHDSSIAQASTSPAWQQTFVLEVAQGQESQLHLTMWDANFTFGLPESFLGEVVINVAKLVAFPDHLIEQGRPLSTSPPLRSDFPLRAGKHFKGNGSTVSGLINLRLIYRPDDGQGTKELEQQSFEPQVRTLTASSPPRQQLLSPSPPEEAADLVSHGQSFAAPLRSSPSLSPAAAHLDQPEPTPGAVQAAREAFTKLLQSQRMTKVLLASEAGLYVGSVNSSLYSSARSLIEHLESSRAPANAQQPLAEQQQPLAEQQQPLAEQQQPSRELVRFINAVPPGLESDGRNETCPPPAPDLAEETHSSSSASRREETNLPPSPSPPRFSAKSASRTQDGGNPQRDTSPEQVKSADIKNALVRNVFRHLWLAIDSVFNEVVDAEDPTASLVQMNSKLNFAFGLINEKFRPLITRHFEAYEEEAGHALSEENSSIVFEKMLNADTLCVSAMFKFVVFYWTKKKLHSSEATASLYQEVLFAYRSFSSRRKALAFRAIDPNNSGRIQLELLLEALTPGTQLFEDLCFLLLGFPQAAAVFHDHGFELSNPRIFMSDETAAIEGAEVAAGANQDDLGSPSVAQVAPSSCMQDSSETLKSTGETRSQAEGEEEEEDVRESEGSDKGREANPEDGVQSRADEGEKGRGGEGKEEEQQQPFAQLQREYQELLEELLGDRVDEGFLPILVWKKKLLLGQQAV
eukprot:765207-Hanusia_phi.AAC.2